MNCLPLLFCSGNSPQEGIYDGQDATRILITRTLREGIRTADIQRLYQLAEDMKQEMFWDEGRLVDTSGFAAHMPDEVFISYIRSLQILQNSEIEEVRAHGNPCSAAKCLVYFLRSCSPSKRMLYAWTLIHFNQDHHLRSITRDIKKRMSLFEIEEIRQLATHMENQGNGVFANYYDGPPMKPHPGPQIPAPQPEIPRHLLHGLSAEAAGRITQLCEEYSRWATPRNERIAQTGWFRVDQSVHFQSYPIVCNTNEVCIQSEYTATIELMSVLRTWDGQEYPLPSNLAALLLPAPPNLSSSEIITQLQFESTVTVVNVGRRRVTIVYKSITHQHNGSNFWKYVTVPIVAGGAILAAAATGSAGVGLAVAAVGYALWFIYYYIL